MFRVKCSWKCSTHGPLVWKSFVKWKKNTVTAILFNEEKLLCIEGYKMFWTLFLRQNSAMENFTNLTMKYVINQPSMITIYLLQSHSLSRWTRSFKARLPKNVFFVSTTFFIRNFWWPTFCRSQEMIIIEFDWIFIRLKLIDYGVRHILGVAHWRLAIVWWKKQSKELMPATSKNMSQSHFLL